MSHEVCLCGHPADDHSELGFCDNEGCECESYRPSDDEGEAVV